MLGTDTKTRISFRTCALLPVLCWCCAISAKTFTVNIATDITDEIPGNGYCSTSSVNGKCSLRAAIQEANALSGADTIILSQSVYTLTISGALEDNAATGDLDITEDLTLVGLAGGASIIDGNKLDRVFDIKNNAAVVMSDVTIKNGVAQGSGGGILLDEHSALNISGCSILKNEASDDGGGIYSVNSEIVIDQCVFDTNISSRFGGGICIEADASAIISKTTFKYNTSGFGSGISSVGLTTTITDSLVYGNRSNNAGAIVTGGAKSILYLLNSTLSENHSDVSAAAIFMFYGSTIYMRNSTVANNEASLQVGGIISNGSFFSLNSIIASNTATTGRRPDCLGTINSQGYNLISDSSGCNFISSEGDQIGTALTPVNALLGSLEDNGGPTLTHALLPNSPAIDAGNPATPGSSNTACDLTDQRGAQRIGRGACDIGSFETTGGGDAWVTVVNDTAVTPSHDFIQQIISAGNKGPNKISKPTLTINLPIGSKNINVVSDTWLCTPDNNVITCLNNSINSQTKSELVMQLTPPVDTKEVITQASIHTVSDDPINDNNQQSLTTVINTPPIIITQFAINYKQNSGSLRISPVVAIEDKDDDSLISASIQFTQGYKPEEDVLHWQSSNRILAHWLPESGTLMLTGEDTLSAYEQALSEVVYQNYSSTPSTNQRGIMLTVSDAYAESAPASIAMSFIESNAGASSSNGVQNYNDNNPFSAVETNASVADRTREQNLAHTTTRTDTDDASNRSGNALGNNGLDGNENIRITKLSSLIKKLLTFLGLADERSKKEWPPHEARNIEDAWLTTSDFEPSEKTIETRAITISTGAIFAVGAVNLYLRAGGILGLLFSFPLWSHIDPVQVLVLSNKERKSRRREMKRAQALEDKNKQIGNILDNDNST